MTEFATKRCSTCRQERPVSDFNVQRRARDGLQSRCRACSAEWYQRNRAEHLARVYQRAVRIKADNRRRLVEYLLEHPCVDCGESDLRVLDFDHREPADKRQNVGTLLTDAVRWARVLAVIEKCDVRCANCHRRVTAARGRWNRHAAQLMQEAEVREAAAGRLTALRLRSTQAEPAVATAAPVGRALGFRQSAPGVWQPS
jgi:hypothetical protein